MSFLEKILLEKLNLSLSMPIENSHDVLYIMVQIRKLIDIENTEREDKGKKEHPYPYLRLYASWLLHVEISTDYQSQLIIKQLDSELKYYIENGNSGYEKGMFPNPLSTEKIKTDLEYFLTKRKLSVNIFSSWNSFTKLLILDLIEVPLLPTNQKYTEYIEKIYYKKAEGTNNPPDPEKRVISLLVITFKKGGRGEMTFPTHELGR